MGMEDKHLPTLEPAFQWHLEGLQTRSQGSHATVMCGVSAAKRIKVAETQLRVQWWVGREGFSGRGVGG